MTPQEALELALEHHRSGRLGQAEAMYRQILAQQPDNPDALHLLGMLAFAVNQNHHAIELIRRAIALRPGAAEFQANLALVLIAHGEFDAAIHHAQAAIAINSNLPDAHYCLALALQKIGQLDEAIHSYRNALALRAEYPDALNNLGSALLTQQRFAEAAEAYAEALRLSPGDAMILENLLAAANALNSSRQFYQAIAAYRSILAANPRHVAAHNNLAHVLMLQGKLDDALSECKAALEIDPSAAEVHNNLGNILRDRGDLDQAIPAYRAAATLRPDFFHGNLLYMLHFHQAYGPEELLREHQLWNAQYAEPLRGAVQPHDNDRNPDRKLRIGYVGPDFRWHSQSHFTIPLLSHHDREKFEIHCYADVPRPDDITDRIQKLADVWRSTVGMNDQRLASLIRADRIDILVDLTMHMAFGRLMAFARKPAPVQLSWLGYPGTTGLWAMDYRLTDPYLDPPGEGDEFYTERSIRLPDSFWCYDPLSDDESPVTPLPALANGHITFGSLNTFAKMNDDVLDLWAATMRAAPDSRLLLLCDLGGQRDHVLTKMRHGQIDESRVQFVNRQPRDGYLRTYDRIDIALDTFPANGHTTSFDALWMGVPVVTLPGRTAISRGGLSILSNLGLPELCATSKDEFVQIAARLSCDLPRLAGLRAGMRKRMQSSPLMDGPRFARNIEAIYRRIWLDWTNH